MILKANGYSDSCRKTVMYLNRALGQGMTGLKSGHKSKFPVLAGIDIGSTKVCFVIGIVNEDNKIEIVGVGRAPNAGIRQGIVVNIEATQNSIKKAKPLPKE